jgi:hypothetical protein
MKYYAVAKGRHPDIYYSWDECRLQVDGYKGAVYKACKTNEEAEEFLETHGLKKRAKHKRGTTASKVSKRAKQALAKKAKYQSKLCLLCGKPKNIPTELCVKCKQRKRELVDMGIKGVSNRNLIAIHKNHPDQDVFDYWGAHPDALDEASLVSGKERYAIKSQEKIKNNELSTIYIDFKNTELKDIPQYLIDLQKELPALSFHTASGDVMNPMIAFTCKRCGKDYKCRWKDITYSSHSCPASTSSGETIVKEFLKEQGIPYLTQRDTLKCINPDTHYVLPYDFQLVNKKVIIEVQGEQHYRFVPVFHGTEEGFKYQQKKDAYKKKHALECGFKYLEIDYKQIEDGSYKQIIMSALI